METLPSSTARHRGGLMFPVILLALGMMFLLDHLVPAWGVRKTWPALLIVIGVLRLLSITRPPRPPRAPQI